MYRFYFKDTVVIYKLKTGKRTHLNLIVANFLKELIVTSEESRNSTKKWKNILESRSEHVHILAHKTQIINNA